MDTSKEIKFPRGEELIGVHTCSEIGRTAFPLNRRYIHTNNLYITSHRLIIAPDYMDPRAVIESSVGEKIERYATIAAISIIKNLAGISTPFNISQFLTHEINPVRSPFTVPYHCIVKCYRKKDFFT